MIDFSPLDNITSDGAKNDFSEPLSNEVSNTIKRPENPVTGENRALSFHRLDKEKRERENMRQMYRDYQQNIRRSGTLRAEILKGIQRGEDPLDLLLKAMECISKMTGDIAIYRQSQKDIDNHPARQR